MCQKHGGCHVAEEDCDIWDSRSDPGDKTWSKFAIKHESEVVRENEVLLVYSTLIN